MSPGARVAALALAGLAAATLLGLTGYLVTRETIALPATSLSAGSRLAPPVPAAPGRAETAPPTATTETAPAGTSTEEDDDRRGRGRGGDDEDRSGPSGSSGSSGSDGSGRGRGRGRGGDDD